MILGLTMSNRRVKGTLKQSFLNMTLGSQVHLEVYIYILILNQPYVYFMFERVNINKYK